MDMITEGFEGPGVVTATFFRGSGFGGEKGFDGIIDTIVNGGNTEEAVDDVEDIIPDEGESLSIYDLYPEGEEPDNKISVSAVFKNLVGGLTEKKPKEEKKSGGLFGMFSQESVQMEESPNEFANRVDDERREDN